MSVVGIDFGTRSCVISVAQKGGVDVITNDVSNRQTPCMVSFGEKERYIGEAGSTQWLRSVKNTVTDIKRILGHNFSDQHTQNELKRIAYTVKDVGVKTVVEVVYCNEPAIFTPEAIAGMILNKLKKITETAIGTTVKDVVISVPGYWNDAQRRAMLDASSIAGLNCLRLMNELTASALGYGIYKTDLPEKDPLKVMIIDIGEASTGAVVVAFQKGQLKVLGSAYDINLGGRNFDDVLLDHFAKEFKEKYKIDVYTNQKALIRLRASCEKLKRVLSANPEAPINIDSLLNDIDVRGMMNRTIFEELSLSLLDKICDPVRRALEDAGVTKEELFAVELTGGGTRLLSVQKRLHEFLGRELSRTLNSEESVARGCALQCAMLSPVFKVREFQVNDVSLYPINLSWKCSTGDTVTEDSAEVFTKNNPIPSPKMITFNRGNSIELIAQYGANVSLPHDQPHFVGKFIIPNIPAPSSQDASAKVRVKVKLDINSIFNLESAQIVEAVDQPHIPDVQSMETEATPPTSGTAEPATTKAEEEPKKRKVKRTDIPFVIETSSLSTQELNKLIDEEGRMAAADQLAIETADRKNAVESYVYNIRSRIRGDLAEFSTETEKTSLCKLLDQTEDWLYGEGEDVTKSVYQGRLDDLQKLGGPIVLRKREHDDRPEAIKALVDAISHWQTEATSLDEKYNHIDKTDKDKVLADVAAARDWLIQQRAKQDASTKLANAVLLSSDILARKNNLERVAKSVLSKPKPKPKPVEPEPKPAETKPTAEAKPTAETRPTTETNPAGTKPTTSAEPADVLEPTQQEGTKETTKPDVQMDVD